VLPPEAALAVEQTDMSEQQTRLHSWLNSTRERIDSLLWLPILPAQTKAKRFALRALQIGYAVIRDLTQGQLSLRAMSLVYYTFIAFIPLLALIFSVLKGLGAHNAMEPALLSLLEPLGERSTEVTRNIISFVENVRVDVLGVLSLAVLMFTVLNMMQTIESAFNFIWGVTKGRKLASRVSDYLFALIVSPVLIFLSIGISSYINTNFFTHYLETIRFGATLIQVGGTLSAYLLMSLAFAFAYRFVPNTKVDFSAAFVGGLMTTFFWKSMGWIFQSFFANSSSNEIIYVAFFTIILVMIFVYLGWLVLLTGSSIAYYFQHPGRIRTGRNKPQLSITEQEACALSVAYEIILRFLQREPPLSARALARKLNMNPVIMDEMLNILRKIKFITSTDEDPQRFLPCSSVETCTVNELREKIRHYTPPQYGVVHPVPANTHILKYLQDSNRLVAEQMGEQTFQDLAREAKAVSTQSAEND
jgi:membrane protein